VAYTVQIAPRALRDLARLEKPIRRRIRDAIDRLRADPRPPGAKALQGQRLFRIRVGDYRVVYEIRDRVRVVLVIRVGHRGDVYRDL
jgi:mRNA interferase RelE/StbE